MYPFLIDGPATDPADALVNCAAAIRGAGWWQRIGEPERWPVATDAAARMLRDAGQYDVTADGLGELIDRHLLAAPGLGEDGAHEWDAADVCRAVQVLETRRQWLPRSQHDCKKTEAELLLEDARANGEVHLVCAAGGPRFDVRHLVEMLVQSQSHEGRRKIATLLRAVLESDHDVTP